MTDTELQEALAKLDITATGVGAVMLLPLLQVAWADGQIQEAERDLLADAAPLLGLNPAAADRFLARWVKDRPSDEDFELAAKVVRALSERSDQPGGLHPEAAKRVLQLANSMAEQAGGIFGIFRRVEPAEREVLERLAAQLID